MSNSIGNLKNSGLQGNNFPWQLKMLVGQQCACDELAAINANTDDVEFLLTSILTTLQASTEYEAKFVVDTCNGDTVYLEVRVWNPDTSTWGPITYYLPGSDTPVIPPGAATPGCLIYTDPSAVLALILGAIQAGNLILTDIETNTGDTVTELQSILALYSAGPQACADSLSVTLCTEQGTSLSNIETNTTGLATEVTVGDIKTSVQLIDNCVGVDGTTAPANSFVVAGVTSGGTQQTIEVNASGHVHIADGGGSITVDSNAAVRTPTVLRTSANSSVAAGAYSVSFASVGTVDSTVGGATLKPGETINFDAGGINNTLGAVVYDSSAVGAELLIITLT